MSQNDLYDMLDGLVTRIETENLSPVVQINIVEACDILGGDQAPDFLTRIASSEMTNVNADARLLAAEKIIDQDTSPAIGIVRNFIKPEEPAVLQRRAFDMIRARLPEKDIIAIAANAELDADVRAGASEEIGSRPPTTELMARAMLRGWLDNAGAANWSGAKNEKRSPLLKQAGAVLAHALPTDNAAEDWDLLARARRKIGIPIPAIRSFMTAVSLSRSHDGFLIRQANVAGLLGLSLLGTIIGCFVMMFTAGLLGLLSGNNMDVIAFVAQSFGLAFVLSAMTGAYFAPITKSPDRLAAAMGGALGSGGLMALPAITICVLWYVQDDWQSHSFNINFPILVVVLWLALAMIRPLMGALYGAFRTTSLRAALPALIAALVAFGLMALNVTLAPSDTVRSSELAVMILAMPSVIAIAHVVRHIDTAKRDRWPTDTWYRPRLALAATIAGGIGIIGTGTVLPGMISQGDSELEAVAGEARFLGLEKPVTWLAAEGRGFTFETTLVQSVSIKLDGKGADSPTINLRSPILSQEISPGDTINLPPGRYTACPVSTGCDFDAAPSLRTLFDLAEQQIRTVLPWHGGRELGTWETPRHFTRFILTGGPANEEDKKTLDDYLALEKPDQDGEDTLEPASGKPDFMLVDRALDLPLSGGSSIALARGTLLVRVGGKESPRVHIVSGQTTDMNFDTDTSMLFAGTIDAFDTLNSLSRSRVNEATLETLRKFAALSFRPEERQWIGNPTLETILAGDGTLIADTFALLSAMQSFEDIPPTSLFLLAQDEGDTGLFRRNDDGSMSLAHGWVNNPSPDLCTTLTAGALPIPPSSIDTVIDTLSALPDAVTRGREWLEPVGLPTSSSHCGSLKQLGRTFLVPIETPFTFSGATAENLTIAVRDPSQRDIVITIEGGRDFVDNRGQGGDERFSFAPGETELFCIGYFGAPAGDCLSSASLTSLDAFREVRWDTDLPGETGNFVKVRFFGAEGAKTPVDSNVVTAFEQWLADHDTDSPDARPRSGTPGYARIVQGIARRPYIRFPVRETVPRRAAPGARTGFDRARRAIGQTRDRRHAELQGDRGRGLECREGDGRPVHERTERLGQHEQQQCTGRLSELLHRRRYRQ